MNRYKITVEYEFVTKSSITKFVISKSREEAEKSVLDTMNPESIKVTGVETSFIPYRTDKWRDLEDLLFEDIQDEKTLSVPTEPIPKRQLQVSLTPFETNKLIL